MALTPMKTFSTFVAGVKRFETKRGFLLFRPIGLLIESSVCAFELINSAVARVGEFQLNQNFDLQKFITRDFITFNG